MTNSKLGLVLKWIYRIICALGAIAIGLTAIFIDQMGTEEVTVILSVLGLLTWQAVRKSGNDNPPGSNPPGSNPPEVTPRK